MKPFIVLLTVSATALLVLKVVTGVYDVPYAARISMSVMLLFTAMGHFMFTEGMVRMIPKGIPFKKGFVYFTGIVEVLGAIGLHTPSLRIVTAWLLILFFVLILPANIKAAIDQLDFQKGTSDGPGLSYLWFRIPLQILFIAWVYFSSIRSY